MAAIMYCVIVLSMPADQKVYEKTTPANMPSPPSVGILVLWDFRWLGSSKRFLITDTLMMEGIAIKVMMKAVMQAKVMFNIEFIRVEITLGNVVWLNIMANG